MTESEEFSTKEKLKSKWARLEALVGAEKRLKQIALDIVTHFENRLTSLDGKGMIVCMSRRICVDLYQAIIAIRPQWHSQKNHLGAIKVVFTGSASDEASMQPHIRTKRQREEIEKRFKNPADELKLVIVRDMWLTGFDVPCLHSMYLDKPMKGHNLMQGIARVNRVFKDKPGGLIVDYIGIADELKEALTHYTEGDKQDTGIAIDVAVMVLQEKYEVVKAMYSGFDYSGFFRGSPSQKLGLIPQAMDHLLGLEDGKNRYQSAVNELSKAFALISSCDEAIALSDEVGFFQGVKVALVKNTITTEPKDGVDLDAAVKQIISGAIVSEEVMDIFSLMGVDKPNIGILSDEFLAEMRGMPQKNLAMELLKKLINDEIKTLSRLNLVKARSFSQMLDGTVKKYQNRGIETAEIITLINRDR